MKKQYLSIAFLATQLLYPQIAPYETTEIKSDALTLEGSSLVLSDDYSGVYNLDANDFTHKKVDGNLYMEILLELDKEETIKLELLINEIDSGSKFFMIDADDNDLVGPF